LSSLDAQLLLAESPATTGHVGTLLVLDPAGAPGGRLRLDDLRDLIEDRLHLAPVLRERVVEVPLGLGSPYWVQDPHFDLEFHTREVALPAPGDSAQLADQVARIHALPLDRSRPLWEMHLVQGVDGDRTALYVKFHSAALDDVSGAPVLSVLLDADSQPREVAAPAEPWQPAPLPDGPSLLANGLASTVVRSGRVLGQLPTRLPQLSELPGVRDVPAARLVSDVAGSVLAAVAGTPAGQRDQRHLTVPPTPFNGAITAHRRFAYASVDLESVMTVTDAFGMTVGDVAMAMTATALRRWLLDHDALPAIGLVIAVPVSARDADADALSMVLAQLPTDVAEPLPRLRAASVAMVEAENAAPAPLLQDFTASGAGALSGWVARSLLGLATSPAPPFNLLVSHVTGPQQPLYVAGARVTGMYPASVITDATGGMNVSLVSYDDSLDVGIVVCREMVPDVRRIVGYLQDALDELVALATPDGDGGQRGLRP